MARWWWPGGSVEAEGLKDHLKLIANAGFGAVEVQPLLLGLGEEEFAADPKLRSVGTPEFYVRLAQAAAAAKENELAFDLTLGSGWPGGLPTSPKNAERQPADGSACRHRPGKLRGPATASAGPGATAAP